ncbi:MAG: hypothetical protein ABI855_06170, partial [Bacteroidota bacterium]
MCSKILIHDNVICYLTKNKFQKNLLEVSFEVFNSVNEFSFKEWNKIAGTKFFLQHSYLKALEKSKPVGISFRYAVVYENKIPVAICYFQIADLTSKELGSLVNLENFGSVFSAVANKINQSLFSGSKYASNNLIVCGSLFVSGENGIAIANEKFFPVVIDLLPELLEKISEQINKIRGRVVCCSIKDFYDESDKYTKELSK